MDVDPAPTRHSQAIRRARRAACECVVLGLLASLPSDLARGEELLWITEGNRLRRLVVDTLDDALPIQEIFIERAADAGPEDGRDVNGMICALPDGSGHFALGEDTGQPSTPPGWGIMSSEGVQVGKLTATYRTELGDPYGCAFDARGHLFTTEIGNKGFGAPRGQLILWFPPYAEFPGPPGAYPRSAATSTNFCKIADDIGTASGLAIDSEGRVYVASSSRFSILRFSPPFPSGADAAGGCGGRDELGSPRADVSAREVFARGPYTYSGMAFGPKGNLFAASVFTGQILEYDPSGRLRRKILDPPGWLPPFSSGNPQGIAFDAAGNLYYADLDLVWDFPSIGPGPDGKLRRIRFDAQDRPGAPETLMEGLAFPDGVAVLPGRLQAP